MSLSSMPQYATPYAAAVQPTSLQGMPNQWLPAHHHDVLDRPESTVLVADPGGTLANILHTALVTHARCRIVHATSVSEVADLVSAGTIGELAMVSVGFQTHTPIVIRALRHAGWERVLAVTTPAVAVKPVMAAVNAGASGVVSVTGDIETEPDPRNPSHRLSAREVEIVRLVAEGCSNKAIAERLSLSPMTIKNHMARIGRKFGAGDRAHIVAIACRGGLIHKSLRPAPQFFR